MAVTDPEPPDCPPVAEPRDPVGERELPDPSRCAEEPIHRPGMVQGRGVVLVLRGDALRIERVSANCQTLLCLDVDAFLGRNLADTLGRELAERVDRGRSRWRESRRQPAHFRWTPTGSAADTGNGSFAGYVHETNGAVVLELEPEPVEESTDADDATAWLSNTLARFAPVRAESDLEGKLQAAAALFRELTGYDRVMIYRFERDWHGVVVAEARREDMTPYLGLHFPASDVPEQARQLYRTSPIRVIDDIHTDAAALLPAPATPDDEALDLSHSVLRSISPAHLEYLHNMGVRATMTASLVHDGELWGLIACHHDTPRRLCQRQRELITWLADDLTTQIVLCEEVRRRRYEARLKRSREAVIEAMRAGARLPELIRSPGLDDLLCAVGADGVALVHDGRVVTGGGAPRPWQILSIARELGSQHRSAEGAAGGSMVVTDCLSEHLDWAVPFADVAAGVILEPLGSDAKMSLIWFRGEQLRHVTWGGEPNKAAIDTDGRIRPRRSFAAWEETVRLRSAPWSNDELASARDLATLVDIELRRIAEQAARDSEAHLRSMVDNAPAYIYVKDLQGRYLMINRLCETLLGMRSAEVAGKTPADILPPQTAAELMTNDQTLLTTLKPQRLEETLETSEGRRTLLSTQFPLLDEAGEASAICGISVDITDRLRIERELKVALAKYQTLFEHFPLGITVTDDRGEIIETNPASAQILAVSEDEHLSRRIDGPQWTILRPDGRAMDTNEYASVRALKERELVRDQEMIIESGAGDRRWLSVTAAPLDAEGTGAVVVYEDITGRKREEALRQAEAATRESERRFRILADELPAMIWGGAPDGRAILLNKTYCEFFGRSEAELLGGGWYDLIHPDDRDEFFRIMELRLRDHAPVVCQVRMRRADGAWRWIETSARHVGDGVFGYVGMNQDVTERKAAEEALRASHRELQRRAEQLGWLTSQLTLAEHRERERLAKVLHDHLQQLLVSALFGVDRAERRLGEAGPDQALEDALEGVKGMVQDAIDAARSLVADLSPPILHEAGLVEALDWLARTMRESYDLRVDLFIDEDLPQPPDDVRSVLFESVREALFNVVKHAECSRAQVTLTRAGDDQLRVVVGDRGKGFDLKRMRKEQASRRETGATGFGLLSMHERMRFLGGTCTIESKPGKGTRLVLTAPLDTSTVPEPDAFLTDTNDTILAPTGGGTAMGPDDRPLRLLIVDDHAMMRQGLSMLLEDEPGIDIVGQAADGLEALELVERLSPDIVLMDYSMPRMDGLEATRRIHRDWPRIRIIGLSMYHEADRGQAMMNAGAAAYVTKTAGREALLGAIHDGRGRDAAP